MDISKERRLDDWIACGGDQTGSFVPDVVNLEKEKRPEEKDNMPAHRRLLDRTWQCMIQKGYIRDNRPFFKWYFFTKCQSDRNQAIRPDLS
ncbi:hypothetical protein HZU77_015305 [Neisseriaceae bacterium TC5R-5]|nr:hypothetical protein [Neisseriaceae bacterium TC5R-5]